LVAPEKTRISATSSCEADESCTYEARATAAARGEPLGVIDGVPDGDAATGVGVGEAVAVADAVGDAVALPDGVQLTTVHVMRRML
jgi:hypothetical protein